MENQLNDLRARADDLTAAVSLILEGLGPIPETVTWSPTSLTFAELVSRADNLASLTQELAANGPDRFLLVPTNRITELRDRVLAITASASTLATQLGEIESLGGVRSFDAASGIVFLNNGGSFSLLGLAQDLQVRLDTALDTYLLISVAVQPRGIGTLAGASRAVTTKAAEAAALVDQLTKTSAEWRASLEVSHAASAKLSSLESETSRIFGEIEKARRTVEENAAKATVSTATVEEVRAQAAALEANVNSYQTSFDAFQRQLEAREKTIATGERRLLEVQAELATEQAKVTALIGQAEQMLGGATTAGLSSAFETKAAQVDTQLQGARFWYYGSIGLLILSVAVALNGLAFIGISIPSLPTFPVGTPTGTIAVQALSALGLRGLVVLPALLLAGFTAHRHSTLFRLREEYSHKYTAAASVQGFKLQAPSFEESIAAAVFAEVIKNPAISMEGRPSRGRNTFLDRMILPRVDAALKEAAKLPDLRS